MIKIAIPLAIAAAALAVWAAVNFNPQLQQKANNVQNALQDCQRSLLRL